MNIKQREINPSVYQDCRNSGYPDIVARIVAGRLKTFDDGILNAYSSCVIPANTMADCPKAAKRIAEAIKGHQKILLFTDYDVDGCTSMAIMFRALHEAFGVPKSKILYLTGHRVEDGYGLTENIANQIKTVRPDLVITADAGSSDHARINTLAAAGIDVIVTDHHILPVQGVPLSAYAVVNPQRDDCPYDTSIAGCGVAWLLMTAVAQELGCDKETKIKIHKLLDFVALGTVADLVPLNSAINRYFVTKGLEFMNKKDRQCWRLALADKDADVGTLGFQIGPRINASSRMSGRATSALIFLISNDPAIISNEWQIISNYNDERKSIEKQMFDLAEQNYIDGAPAIIAYHESFEPGVQGIVASKLVEKFGVPAIMLSKTGNGDFIVGSGRAGQFLHLRDALQFVEDQHPGILVSFGGHKAAAGLKFRTTDLELFSELFLLAAYKQLDGLDTTPYIKTDGTLLGQLTLDTHYLIKNLAPFGMGFSTPIFSDTMTVTFAKMVGQNPVHLSLMLNNEIKAIQFSAIQDPGDPMPVNVGDRVDVVYQTDVNLWNNVENLQLKIKIISQTSKA